MPVTSYGGLKNCTTNRNNESDELGESFFEKVITDGVCS